MLLLLWLSAVLSVGLCVSSHPPPSPVTNVAIKHVARPVPALRVSFDADNQFVVMIAISADPSVIGPLMLSFLN
jgi:hypothetical protein